MNQRIPGFAYDTAGGYRGLQCVRKDLQLDKAKMTATGVFASSNPDRVGDVLEIAGIKTENHQRNPIVLFDHGYGLRLPIGSTVDATGKYLVELKPDEGIAVATTVFSQVLPEAMQVYALIDEGTLRAQSIGFRSLRAESIREDNRFCGEHILESEMLETSWTALGCNPDAVRSLLSKGTIGGDKLAPLIRKSLLPFASKPRAWAHGATLPGAKTMPKSETPAATEKTDESAYGYCPKCGAKGNMRERRPGGDDTCEKGHKYPSKSALAAPPVGVPAKNKSDDTAATPVKPDETVAEEPKGDEPGQEPHGAASLRAMYESLSMACAKAEEMGGALEDEVKDLVGSHLESIKDVMNAVEESFGERYPELELAKSDDAEEPEEGDEEEKDEEGSELEEKDDDETEAEEKSDDDNDDEHDEKGDEDLDDEEKRYVESKLKRLENQIAHKKRLLRQTA